MKKQLFVRLKKDIHFRIKLFLCLTLCFNGLYSVFLIAVGKIYFSKWFFSIAIYYGLLFLVRLVLFLCIKPTSDKMSTLKILSFCGYFLLVINLAVSTMMFILANGNQQMQYHEITVITLAVYTFGALTLAIIGNIGHLKKYKQAYFCIKIISLVSASVSLVTLTNTMLSTFGNDNLLLRSIVMPLLSGSVALFVMACAIFVIYKANGGLRKCKNEQKSKQRF